ncbi:uncharacterized protein A1O5_12051 [Cladophialophora psammophila CBS 110553]|uniref:Uncharacterized protein n=1 Tax=Cladophialophora psammophila CBS 110553 TaxID=1182543 RepID=W9WSC8_9EURO|nr:uncharacterized protein A1O5_12051 [Cladophialophora psammophila CBS 110553]EXJ61259.1 hypothetical protein A1O5_12051 [Cladophialophora psammophila CBS 110553]
MASPPYIFFHNRNGGYWWHEKTDPILQNCRTINEEAAQSLLSSLTVNVSQPCSLLRWLNKNHPAYITDLVVFVDACCDSPPAMHWSQLFEKLGREATNLQHLTIYWDSENFVHRGLGKDLCFVRALTQLKVKKTITIEGFYAL